MSTSEMQKPLKCDWNEDTSKSNLLFSGPTEALHALSPVLHILHCVCHHNCSCVNVFAQCQQGPSTRTASYVSG